MNKSCRINRFTGVAGAASGAGTEGYALQGAPAGQKRLMAREAITEAVRLPSFLMLCAGFLVWYIDIALAVGAALVHLPIREKKLVPTAVAV